MKIKSVEITNVKGIGNQNFQLDLIPNKPNILVEPNGFGKNSFGIAFDLLHRKEELDAKHYHYDESITYKKLFFAYNKMHSDF